MLKKIYLNENVQFVKKGAFWYCDSLEYVRIKRNEVEFEDAPFAYAKSLNYIMYGDMEDSSENVNAPLWVLLADKSISDDYLRWSRDLDLEFAIKNYTLFSDDFYQ